MKSLNDNDFAQPYICDMCGRYMRNPAVRLGRYAMGKQIRPRDYDQCHSCGLAPPLPHRFRAQIHAHTIFRLWLLTEPVERIETLKAQFIRLLTQTEVLLIRPAYFHEEDDLLTTFLAEMEKNREIPE